MHPKYDAGVEARLREAERHGEAREIAVIVTLLPQGSWSALRQHGLQIRHVFESLHAVSGRVSTNRVSEIAALDWVLRIEFDGEVRALPEEHG